ncbi:MAG: radical SAM protein [Coprobacillus sp.]
MKKITILIKPVSSSCNMQCEYCFYKDVSQYRDINSKLMSQKTIHTIIEKVFNIQQSAMQVEFCFQGGEPLLAGIDFYRYFISIVNKVNKIHTISFSIQTNGILINQEWVDFFKQYHFLVGVSLDGVEEVHDYYRIINKENTHKEIVKGITLLQKNSIDFNILSVITPKMSTYAKEIYHFYKTMNYKYIQFIPCLPFLDGTGGLKPKEYARFYKELYDEFINDKSIHIDLFEQIALLKRGVKECSCGMLGYCSFQFVMEANGDIFPCDFYAIDKYRLGNIHNIDLKDIMTNQRLSLFLTEDKCFSNLCDHCQYYKMCQGQCKRQNVCLFDDDYCGYQDLLKYIDKIDI